MATYQVETTNGTYQVETDEDSSDQEKGGYFHELYRQLIADPIKAFKADPIGTLAHLIGSAGGIATGTTPVPGPGGQIQVAGPTQQMQGVADIAERGPAAIGAAATIGALPIAARYAGPLAAGAGGAVKGAAQAAVAPAKIPYLRINAPFGNLAAGTMAGRYAGRALGSLVGAPAEGEAIGTVMGAGAPLIRGAVQGARKALTGKLGTAPETTAPPAGRIPPLVPPETEPAPIPQPVETPATATAPEVSPELQALQDGIAQSHGYKDFASVKDPGYRATIENVAKQINSGATPPESAAATRPGPQLVPKTTPSGQDIIRGSSNIPLSRQGYAEAHRLADTTAGQWDEIHTSPLDRAKETAQIVADVNPQAGAPQPTEALTPWYLGQHEGQPTTAVLDKMQQLIEKPDEVPTGRGPQSTKPGQSFNDFKAEFLGHVKDQIDAYQPGQKILNATHYRDTRVLQAWAKAGAPDDFSIDVPTMMQKGDVKPGDMLRLDPKTMKVEATRDASQPGIYFARHGATEWNAENGTVNPAESAGAPGPRGPASVPPQPAAVPPEQLARLNAGAPPEPTAQPPVAAAPPETGYFLRNQDLDKIADGLRAKLKAGATREDVAQIISNKPGVEAIRDQLGLKGRYGPGMSDYLRRKVFK